MHPRILAERNATAHNRLVKAAELLGERYGINDEVDVLISVRSKDKDIKALKEREALVAVLEALAQVDVSTAPAEPSQIDREALRAQLMEIKGVGERVADEVLNILEGA